jgi:hypothetical protein
MMAKIITETEAQLAAEPAHRRRSNGKLSISETICESVAHAAQELDMRAISVYTETGTTARLISKYRPKTDIYAFSYVPSVCNRVNLLWGVAPIICEHTPVTDDMVRSAERLLWQRGVVHNGDVISIVAGTRTASGSTNFLRLHRRSSAIAAHAEDCRGKKARVGRRRMVSSFRFQLGFARNLKLETFETPFALSSLVPAEFPSVLDSTAFPCYSRLVPRGLRLQ